MEDHVLQYFTSWIPETVRVYSNGDRGNDSFISASLFPFPETRTILVVGACIHAGTSENAPPRDYSLEPKKSARAFSAFTSISILAAIFGNGILPKIQATLAPPATGKNRKMVKGLTIHVLCCDFGDFLLCCGFWVLGIWNKSSSNIFKSLLPNKGPSLAPTWVNGLAVIFVLLQLFAIGLVSS